MSNNKYNCKILYNNKIIDLIDKLNSEDINQLEIELCGYLNITDMSYMFYNCTHLSSLPDIYKWNTDNITNMRYIFSGCKSLLSLPDISKMEYY